MPKFQFKLDFLLSSGNRIHRKSGAVRLVTESAGAKLTLHVPIEPEIKFVGLEPEEDGRGSIYGGPYATREEAFVGAIRTKATILIWAVREKVGVDFHHFPFNDTSVSKEAVDFPPLLRDGELSMGSGIEIMLAGKLVASVLVTVVPNADRTPEKFAEEFRDHHSENLRLSPKQIVAIQLYNSSVFDTSEQSRFISAISAVEALIDSTQLEEDSVRRGLQSLKAHVDTMSVDEATKKRLKEKLERAKDLSIAKGGRKLVATLLSNRTYQEKSAAKTFEKLYTVRSSLVHDGHPGMSPRDFQGLVGLCRSFVSELLIASIEQPSTFAPPDLSMNSGSTRMV